MPYTAIETSVQQGTPIELYEFTQGLRSWRFASCAEPITRLGQVFTPSNIRRDRVKQSTDIFKNGLRLTFSREDGFASQFLGFAPEEITTVSVFRGHFADSSSEFIVYWKGRVLSARASDSQIELECEPVYTSIRRPGLRAKFEYSCRHALYSGSCGALKESHRVERKILTVDRGLEVALENMAGFFVDGWFTGGVIAASDGTTRFLVGHAAGLITLSRPMASLAPGQTAWLYPGCDHLRGTCETKFSNLDNFGGFPWIPVRNPYNGSSIA